MGVFKTNKEILGYVRTEIEVSFELEEILKFDSFEDFYAQVDVQNAYEEEWMPNFYRPYYLAVYNDIKSKESVWARRLKRDINHYSFRGASLMSKKNEKCERPSKANQVMSDN